MGNHGQERIDKLNAALRAFAGGLKRVPERGEDIAQNEHVMVIFVIYFN